MEKYKKPLTIVFLILLLILGSCFAFTDDEPYVFYDNKYYRVLGATIDESKIKEYIGQIERITFRSVFNKNGDSNIGNVGTKICVDKNNTLCVEIMTYISTENISTPIYFVLHEEK